MTQLLDLGDQFLSLLRQVLLTYFVLARLVSMICVFALGEKSLIEKGLQRLIYNAWVVAVWIKV